MDEEFKEKDHKDHHDSPANASKKTSSGKKSKTSRYEEDDIFVAIKEKNTNKKPLLTGFESR